MQNSQNKKTLQIVLVVLIAVLTLGIGYASITAINLIISGNATASVNQDNFKVYFVPTSDTPSLTGNVPLTGSATIDTEDNTIAHFNVSGLTKEGDYAIATYTIINNSEGVGAEITLNLTSSNTEYFKVTETITDNILQAGDTTTGTIKVEMIKTPIENEVSTNVIGTLTATPMENAQASGGEQASIIGTKPYVYTINGVDAIYINTDISEWTRKYSSFAAAKQEFGHPAAIANIVENGLVKESYVAFERNGTIYYLKGGVNESSLQDKSVYNANVAELKKAFPDWETTCNTDNSSYFSCNVDDFYSYANDRGNVGVNGPQIAYATPSWSCSISNNVGQAGCSSH